MAKATTTIKQILNHHADQGAWFAANQALFNRVVAFYFEVIQAHEQVLDLSNKDALTALEKLTHTTQRNPAPVMPVEALLEDIPAMFRRAAINAALGSARSFYSHLAKWRKRKEKAEAKGEVAGETASSTTLMEQSRNPVYRHVEGARRLIYCAEGLDRDVLELDQGSHHWTCNTKAC